MGFGVSTADTISKNTAYTAQYASKMNEIGVIDEEETYGAVEETTEEVYVDAGSFTNLATNGQTGTSVAAIVTSHSLIESNTDFARASKVSRKPLTS